MRNSPYLALALILLAGCAARPRFEQLPATTPEAIWAELIRQDQALATFSADAEFAFRGPKGNINLKGSVALGPNGGGVVDVIGPLGARLATISMSDDSCLVDLPQTGQTYRLNSLSPLSIPGLNSDLPPPAHLWRLLRPTVDFGDAKSWHIAEAKMGSPATVTLEESSGSSRCRLDLMVSTDPVMLQDETRTEGEWRYHRLFHYNGKPELPVALDITSGDFALHLKYSHIRINAAGGKSGAAKNI